VILRRWLAMDSCNNSNVAFQTITVRDTTAPVLTLPSNRTLNCPGDTRTNNTGVATATDACGGVTISYSDVVSNSCGITKTVWRTWTVVDQCGNSANGLQIIIVQDTAPTMSCPSVNVQCVGDVPPPYTNIAAFRAAGGVANDACDADLSFVLVSNSVMVGSCPGRITRIYRVTDDCGLAAQCTQTVIVDDTIAPTLTCAPSVTIECGSSLDPAVLGNVTATDNCDTNVSITYSDVSIQSTYDINWYAADPAANSAPYLPGYLKLAPGSLPCPTGGRAADPLRNAVAFGPTAGELDALTSLAGESMSLGQILPFEAVIDVSGAPGPEHGTIEFTTSWSTYTTSNDRFGFDKNYKVYCAFVDSADIGSIDPHVNAKVESFSSTIINTGTIDEKILGTFRVSGLDPGDRVIVEVWMVLMSTQPDHVGGTIASELVSAQKVLNPPQPLSVGGKTISISAHKFDPLPPPQEQPPLGPLPPQPPVPPGLTTSVIDRTWAATDDCGNRSTCVQRITVRDTTPPSLTAPNLVLECPADTSTNSIGMASVFDACGLVNLGYSDVVSNSCGFTKTVLRTWKATDGNNNTNSLVQTIVVNDTMAPILTVGTNRTINAGAAFNFDTPVATDTCGTATFSLLGTVTNNILTPIYDITRSWRATDACGNATTNQQTISVIAALPRVSLVSAQSRMMTLRWPAYATDYRLEFSVDLKKWSPAGIVPVNSNGWCIVQVPMTGPQKFFRLVNTPPTLDTAKTSSGKLRLTWPTEPAGFQLEASDTMSPGSWTPVLIAPGVTNLLNQVDVPLNAPKKFFRLKK